MQVVSQHDIGIAYEVRFRGTVGQLYSFFISAFLFSARASSVGTAPRK